MKKIKSFILGVINWFRVKIENVKLKKQIKELKSVIKTLLKERDELQTLVDMDFNAKKVKDMESTIAHQMEVKHKLRDELKETENKLKEAKEEIRKLKEKK